MYESDYEPTSNEPPVPLTREVLTRSVLLVLVSLSTGAFLVWIVRFEFVLRLVSVAIELSVLALGCFAGQKVYRLISKPTPTSVRIAVAIIIGLSVSITALELTRSHKLIRISEQMFANTDDE